MAKLSARSSPPASPAGAALPARGAAGACTPRFMSGGAAWTATVHPAADKASANANRREGTAAGSTGEPERRDAVRPAGGAQGRGPGRGDRSALSPEVVGPAAGLPRRRLRAPRIVGAFGVVRRGTGGLTAYLQPDLPGAPVSHAAPRVVS